MRITLLEVIQRAEREVLAHLFPIALVAQVIRRPRALDRFDREPVHLVGGRLVRPDLADLLAHRGQERVLQLTP